ncbi:YceI family protein [Streptomyces sp. NPDC058623]|uniref:YceI family protein n=1 Tax=Streptomyces sp. NPDC058623 TaxID=3346563 RepID=UPI00365D29DA
MATSTNNPLPPAGTYDIDPAGSTVAFDTRAMFGLLPVRGTFTIVRGRIVVAEPAEESSVHVVIEAGSFQSGSAQRDHHVRSPDYLNVDRHPEIDFRSRKLERSGSNASLHGDLTVCGAAQPVSVTLTNVVHQDECITAGGVATIDRYAFGVTKAKGMTGRHLNISLEIVAHR